MAVRQNQAVRGKHESGSPIRCGLRRSRLQGRREPQRSSPRANRRQAVRCPVSGESIPVAARAAPPPRATMRRACRKWPPGELDRVVGDSEPLGDVTIAQSTATSARTSCSRGELSMSSNSGRSTTASRAFSTVTATSCRLTPRSTDRVTGFPMRRSPRSSMTRESGSEVTEPSKAAMTSPTSRPAEAAGLFPRWPSPVDRAPVNVPRAGEGAATRAGSRCQGSPGARHPAQRCDARRPRRVSRGGQRWCRESQRQ